jgi:hypothetical protein
VATADLGVLRGSRATMRGLLGDAVADRDTDATERSVNERAPGNPLFVAPEALVAPEDAGRQT